MRDIADEPNPVSVALAAEAKRQRTRARSEAMLARFGLGPEGKTCGECHSCHRPVEAPYMCREAWLHRMAYGKWNRSSPSCGRWRE